MRFQIIINILGQAIIGIICLILPLFFGYFYYGNNLFELPKSVFFQILTLFLFLVYLCQQFCIEDRGRNYIWSGKYLVFIFVVISLFFHSLFLTINQENSFFGLYDRQQGFISFVYYVLFFYLIVKIVKREQIRNVLIAVSLSALVVSLYGVAQRLGWDFVAWTEAPDVTHRIFSSLGQPVFLADYLVLVLPLSFYLFFTSRSKLFDYFYFLSAVAQIVALGLTFSFSGLLVLFFELIAIYLFVIRQLRKKEGGGGFINLKLKIFASGGVLLILGLVSLFYGFKYEPVFASKLQSLNQWQGSSGQMRVIYWQASWQAIKDRPLLGYGLENQGEVLTKYYDKKWAELEFVNMTTNRAHNIFLDILLTTGVLGFILFLIALFYVFRLTWRNYQVKNDVLSIFLGISIFFLLFALQFSFLFVTACVYLALYVALLFLINKDCERNQEDKSVLKECLVSNKLFRVLEIIFGAGAIAACLFLINTNFNKLIIDQYYRAMLQANHESSFFGQLDLYDYIKTDRRSSKFYDQQFVLIMNDLLRNSAGKKKMVGEIKDRVEVVISGADKDSDSFSNKLTKARGYAILSIIDKEKYAVAKKIYEELIVFSPGLPIIRYELASLSQVQADYQASEKYYQDFLNTLPDLTSPLMNFDHKQAVANEKIKGLAGLGDVYMEQKKWSEAKNFYEQALAVDDKKPSIYYRLGRLYFNQRDFEQAIWYNNKASELDPKNYFYPYITAIFYKEMGDKDKAKEYIQKALTLNPYDSNALDLARELKK